MLSCHDTAGAGIGLGRELVLERQGEHQQGAAGRPIACPDTAAVQLDDLSGDRQSETSRTASASSHARARSRAWDWVARRCSDWSRSLVWNRVATAEIASVNAVKRRTNADAFHRRVSHPKRVFFLTAVIVL